MMVGEEKKSDATLRSSASLRSTSGGQVAVGFQSCRPQRALSLGEGSVVRIGKIRILALDIADMMTYNMPSVVVV